MSQRFSALWLWLALLSAFGHDVLPAVHQHAHLRAYEASVAVAADLLDESSEPSPQSPADAKADDCAICAHFASLCPSLRAEASVAPALRQAPSALPRGLALVPLPEPAWLLAAPRAPPVLSAFA
ncbi:hypothetical protein SAMN04489711_101100 [Paracidovorax wautersii]|uniref:DUF2946 domain-containing protein n=1 Tax=Paracidovorax wautersii TaxID=1177982 RepID=A0A1I1ZJ21_9BURK|nr:hypothetical protein SAMN04489711_101100 [Paracidovorax wautersii]